MGEMPRGYGSRGEFYWFMEKRKQASRTPNASRNTTARSMSGRQGVRGLPNLAAAFGVREACFRFGLSHASMLFGIGRTGKLFLFQVQRQWAGRRPHRLPQKLRCSRPVRFRAIPLAPSVQAEELVTSPMRAGF